ncbi:MAG: alanine racemase [Gammaproteobacteria bacterium]|nr:alanine racemase [Gammaproteobacteria bacterium]
MAANPHRAWAEINPAALSRNLARARALAPGARVMCVVKADAYGHGAAVAAAALADADAFGVASLEEALALRAAGVTAPVAVLSGFFAPQQVAAMREGRIDAVVHNRRQREILRAAAGRRQARIHVWLKVDSGMGRLGFAPDEAEGELHRLRATAGIGEVRLMTHFAAADGGDAAARDFTESQLRAYRPLRGLPAEHSLANSAALLAWPDSHADWVRPGVMLYGASPFAHRTAADCGLAPAMRFCARLVAVRMLRKGAGVGYGPLYRCPEDMPVGVAACGYADGYPRLAGAASKVAINGIVTATVGAVSMDSLSVDLRPLASTVRVGDEVELWGGTVGVNSVAAAAGTIPHHLLSALGARVPRTVISEVQ